MKTYLRTLYPGEHFEKGRHEIVREKLNADGFYVLSGANDTLHVSALSDDVYFEQMVAEIVVRRFFKPLFNLITKIGVFVYGFQRSKPQ